MKNLNTLIENSPWDNDHYGNFSNVLESFKSFETLQMFWIPSHKNTSVLETFE
jgi:hypothetical protein